jgi:uncharacterized protein YjbI with pentapeptide repeats
MANPKHLAEFKKGFKAWNQWRKRHPKIAPDLSRVSLVDLYDLGRPLLLSLPQSNLSGVNLHRARLSGADLHTADLSGANLSEANLSGADFSKADLSEADLTFAHLVGAHLTGANLPGQTSKVRT